MSSRLLTIPVPFVVPVCAVSVLQGQDFHLLFSLTHLNVIPLSHLRVQVRLLLVSTSHSRIRRHW